MFEKEVLALYKFAGIESFPVDIFTVITTLGYRLMTYREAAKNEIELRKMKLISGDAFVIRKLKLICYNDQVPSKNRIRFSLAHEVGHIVMMTDDETIADAFAAALLAPKSIMFARQIRTAKKISETFEISVTAANSAVLDRTMAPTDDMLAMIDYFGERHNCPWPFNQSEVVVAKSATVPIKIVHAKIMQFPKKDNRQKIASLRRQIARINTSILNIDFQSKDAQAKYDKYNTKLREAEQRLAYLTEGVM